jgi:hypothetical protein
MRELTETFQALDDTGTVYTIQVFTEVSLQQRPDGSEERLAGVKTHQTVDGEQVFLREDGTLERARDGLSMHRITSP